MAENDKIYNNRRKLYVALSQHVSNLGTFDEFNSRMDDEKNRQKTYKVASQRISNIGTWEEFNDRVYRPAAQRPDQSQSARQQEPATAAQQPSTKDEKPAEETQAAASGKDAADGWRPSTGQRIAMLNQIDGVKAGMDSMFRESSGSVSRILGDRIESGNKDKPQIKELKPGELREVLEEIPGNRTTQQNATEKALQITPSKERGDAMRRVASVENQTGKELGEEHAAAMGRAMSSAEREYSDKTASRHQALNFGAPGQGAANMVMRSQENFIDYLTTHDIDRLMDKTWNELDQRSKDKMIEECYSTAKMSYSGLSETELRDMAKGMARLWSDKQLYEELVKRNAPKSNLDYLARKISDGNLLMSIAKGAAVASAGTTGDMSAYEAANERYRLDGHKVIDAVGTAAAFGLDPTTWLSGLFGKAASRGILWAAGKRKAQKGASKAVGDALSREFGSTLSGRMIAGSAGGAGTFAALEGMKEAEGQFVHGGHISGLDESGRYLNEGYSASAIAKQALHGAAMGASIGWIAPYSGNVSDKLVMNTAKTINKAATRMGVYMGATTLEGTIFSIPEWISGERDGMDVWTDNMLMMGAFKAPHVLKVAGNVLGDLRSSFENPANGRKNRLDFESRMRMRMDAASDGGLALTKDEKAELKRYGYDLRELVESAEKTGNAAEGGLIAENAPEFVSRLTDMVSDPRISEAARAKMYYYATGRKLPASTIMRGEIREDGNGKFIVEAQGANGVVTSRAFNSRKAADLELGRISRQVELNRIEIGERYQQTVDLENRLQEACRTVAEENGWNAVEVYRTCEEARRNHLRGGDKQFDEARQNILRKVADAMGEFTETDVTDTIRTGINEKYGVDIDAAIRKEANRRTQVEQNAIDEYLAELIPDEAKANPFEDASVEDVSNQKRINGIGVNPNTDVSENSERFGSKDGEKRPIGMATMKYSDRQVEVIDGNVVLTDDGTNVDIAKSDATIAVRDVATGKVEMIAPENILTYEEYAGSNAIPNPRGEEYHKGYDQNVESLRRYSDEELDAALNASQEYRREGKLDDYGLGRLDAIIDEIERRNGGSESTNTDMPTEYSAGSIIFRGADGKERQGFLTGEFVSAENYDKLQTTPDNIGKYEYYIAPDYDKMYYATKGELDNMVIKYEPEVVPAGETNDYGNSQEARFDSDTKAWQQIADEYDRGYEEGLEVAKAIDDATLDDAINELRERYKEGGLSDEWRGRLEAYEFEQQERAANAVPENAETVPSHAENAAPVVENGPESVSSPGEAPGARTTVEPTPLQRIPRNEKGEPIFEHAATPELGWDALVEFSEGDAATAKEIADTMAEEKRKAFEKAQKLKPKGKTPTEILASKKANAAELANTQAEYEHWLKMAGVERSRQNAIRAEQDAEARRLAAERAEKDIAERAAQEETKRIEREALNGIPEWHMDTPENARARGSRRFSGQLFTRQEPVQGVAGKEVEVKFSQKDMPKGRVAVIEAGQLQPSHLQGQRNPMFFIDEAQPKNRSEAVSAYSAQRIAEGIRPEEITGGTTAYTGAPTVNARGEVIQGNNRSDALRYLWENNLPQQQAAYKQYLIDNAEQLGIYPEAVNTMRQPVLVNTLDVDDAEAIRLGQMTAQDTESGGIERIKPKNVAQKLGDDMRQFANMLLRSGDEEASFGQLVDRNGIDVMKWMSQVGAISNTQYQSAFDSKGNLSAEAKNDLQKVLYQAVFKGGSQQLEEMFDKLPAKAQRALLGTAFRDMDSPPAGKMIGEIQASIAAYNALMQDPTFAEAKKMEDVLRAVESFKATIALDDRFEQYMPADNFSNFALHLAAIYKASDMSQSTITSYFNRMYDLAQGKVEASLFEEADTTQYPIAEVIKKVLNIDYKPAKNGNNNVANGGADVALLNQVGQGGELRGNEPPASGEQTPAGTEPSDRGAGAADDSRGAGNEGQHERNLPQEVTNEERTEMQSRIVDWLSEDNLAKGVGKTRAEIFDEFGNAPEPIAYIPTQFLSLVDPNIVDQRIYCGKGYFIDHALRNHAQQGKQISAEDVDVSKYLNIQTVLDNPDSIKETFVDGKRTVVFIKKIGRYFAELTQVEEGGKIILHKSTFNQKKEPYAKLNDIRRESSSSEGGTSSISHADKSAPAISLESRGDDNVVESISSNGTTTDTAINPKGKGDGTARSLNGAESDGKVNTLSIDKQISGKESSLQPSDDKGTGLKQPSVQTSVQAASAEVNTEPTPAQAEAGNYKKGHVTIGDFDITIENPAGSIRKGVDADGKEWQTTMANTYGYIKGTESVDGDHIDVFLHTDMDEWNGRKVFVVDQTKADGSFDEHKVMLGFNDKDEAMSAYLANYDATWAEKHPGLRISEVNIEDFDRWIKSSHRKTKPFADYSVVRHTCPVCGKHGIQDYKSEGGVCPQCGTDLDVFRAIDSLNEEQAREIAHGISSMEEQTGEYLPVGNGFFGMIYDQFKGKVKEAVSFLSKVKGGDLLGVFKRNGFGDVDLVWGDKNGGWNHILNKHVGEGKSFATPAEAAEAIDEIIKNGDKDFENGDKAVFMIGTRKVTVRKNFREKGKKIADKNWVLTAYDESAADNGSSAITKVNEAKAAPGTAQKDGNSADVTAGATRATNRGQAAQTTELSESKGSQKTPDKQEDDGEDSASEPLIPYNSTENVNFADKYETQSGKTINYTSENSEAYGGLFDFDLSSNTEASRGSDVQAGRDRVQREENPLLRRESDRLKPKAGEFSHVERVFVESKSFDFTTGNEIKGAEDVAFIFSQLEDESVEHTFAVFVKDGQPTVVELCMGLYNSSHANIPALKEAYRRLNPDEVYFVHNHPSGNLSYSQPDILLTKKMEDAIGHKIAGVIVNLRTGKFGTFTTEGYFATKEKNVPAEIRPLKIYRFGKQVFADDYDPAQLRTMRGADDVAAFIQSHRLGGREKISLLICNQANKIVANVHTQFKSTSGKGLVDAMVHYINTFGGQGVFIYGNGVDNTDFKKLQEAVKEASGGNFQLMDMVKVQGEHGGFTSAYDSMVWEPGSDYGGSDIRFREVEDDAVLTEFAEGKTVKAYRTMQIIDGKLYSPMATKVGGKNTPEIKLGMPEQSEEHPEIIKGTKIGKDGVEHGYVVIDKGLGKGSLTVAYNPYAHTSRTVLNDQFSSAYIRPNLVTVEVEVPESELTSGYRADKAKDAVGEISWHSGSVSGQLAAIGKPRRVILTRYDKPVRIIPFREVAQMIAEQLDGTNIAIPFNVVQPQLRAELERLGITISEEASGSVGNEVDYGKAEYITDQEIERINARQREMMQTSSEAKRNYAERMAKKFNTSIRIVENPEELTHHDVATQEAMRRNKGYFDLRTGEIVVVVPNNATVEDVAETVFHEVVAHKGLRELIGEENYDAFCDEIYNHLKDDLKQQIDEEATRRFVDEPGKGYEHHRRVAVDEMFGRMSEKGFEDFTKAERGIWAKLKAKVLEAINKFLGSQKLPKWVKLGDNELRYMLWRSHERLSDKGDYVDMARDAAKREELGLTDNRLMHESREQRELRQVNARFNEQLQQQIDGQLPEDHVYQMGKAGAILRSTGVANLPIELRAKRLKDKATKYGHNYSLAEVRDLPKALQTPVAVFAYGDPSKAQNIVLQLRSGEKNFIVGLSITPTVGGRRLEINSVRNVFPKDNAEWVKWIADGKLLYIDKEKIQPIMNQLQTIPADVARIRLDLKAAAKIIKNFENPSIDDAILFRDGETGDIWKDHSVGMEERITNAAIRLSNNQSGDLTLRNDAMRAIGGNLTSLRKAMALQRKFDQTTVKRVADLARILMQNGYLSGMTSGETQRLLAAVKNSVGHQEVKESVQRVMDIMVDNQLRNGEGTLRQLLAIRGSKMDARGVEVQGMLDVVGQDMMQAVKGAISMKEDDILDAIAEAQNRMSDPNDTISDHAAIEYVGLNMALDYVQNIADSKAEEKTLRDSLKTAKEDRDAGRMTDDAYKQYVEATEDVIRKNKIERAEAYFKLVGRLSDSLRGSIENAKAFREAEKARVNEIHHNANSDMEGRPNNEHHRDDWKDKVVNNGFVQFLFSPLATFDQVMRVFGNKSANGEGYLWNRFMRGWVVARNKELTGVKEKFAQLDDKAAELFGKGKTWGSVIRMESKLPKATVSFWDGGEMRDHELTQGNLLYIYMVDKMTDGRMKLRRMGITEQDIANIENSLDPRFKALGDWLQDEFLVATRNEYNETHKRMFGASMAAIENYFPLKILANARIDKEEDVNQPNRPDGITTKTGSIIKRRVNNLALDITGADALSVILDHITQMEHWNAYAEWNRDLNTLRTYKRFRNQVINMTTIYGGGRKLWGNFNDLCLMAAGEYRPPIAKLDKSAVNIAKGVTAAKVSFRMFTTLKQLLSAPAYAPEVSISSIAKSIANPYSDFKWCMDNLPIFRERWHSRISGDPRLLMRDKDWNMWRSRVMEICTRIGMTPNAFVDAVTVSIGARAMHKTRLKQYLREGYPADAAEERAKQDAAILFNQTQQSSESPFLSTMQVDGSWLSVVFSIFRNSSMSYSRQVYDAMRNLKRNLTPGQRAKSVEFMTKQILRDWNIDPDNASDADKDKAEDAAKKRFRRQIKKDIIRLAIFGFILEFAWNLGPYLPYIIFGNDEDEKDKMWDDAATHAIFGSVEGLTGGDVMSSFGNMAASGEWSFNQLTKDMPIASDINSIANKFVANKNAEAINDIIFLIVQSGIGMNPQSITDAAVAFMDACGDDPALCHEAAIFVMRVLQVPQSQIDKIYFDEIGLSGEEASKLTPEQLAQRYAEYKVKRGTPLAPWSWGDEERTDKYLKLAEDKMKERLESQGDAEVNEAYADFETRYKAVSEKAKGAKALMKTDYTAAAQAYAELQQDPDFSLYRRFGRPDKQLSRMSKMWLASKSPEEAALISSTITSYRSGMVRALQAETDEAFETAMAELTNIMVEFYAKYQTMQSAPMQPNR